MADIGRIAEDLRVLRKGRGLRAADLDRRVSPRLWELVDARTRGADPRRQALAAELGRCAGHLQPDLRTAALAALGLTADTADMIYFKDRVAWLAQHLERDFRTALRRMDTAGQLLAEQVADELDRRSARVRDSSGGWYLGELHALLRLDKAAPETHQTRRIVATRDGLSEVAAWLDAPARPGAEPPAPSVEVAFGGTLVRSEAPGPGRFRYTVRLPWPLRSGQSHEFGLLLRMPAEAMRPHYLFVPEMRCDLFTLRVRFAPDSAPSWVRCVHGETVREFDAGRPSGELLEPDPSGEVRLEFAAPAMHLGYGAQWHS
ncbi:hypothetical protein [Streptomyces sp. NPDC020983]|uniref:hypothetical protein n=1 Tax=Streptomyces sp. NPDC020983 TaxID=3365106 RepID=UPI003796F310